MQRAVDVLGAPVLEAKRVCQCQLISLQAPATGLPFTGAGCSLPHSAWPLPLPDSLEPAGGDASWSPPGHSICRNVPHPAGTSFLAAHVSQLKAMSCEGVAVTLFMGTLCYIKNEMVCNLTHNSEILPCSSWNLRHTAVLLFQGRLDAFLSRLLSKNLQLKWEISLFPQQHAGNFRGNSEINKKLI